MPRRHPDRDRRRFSEATEAKRRDAEVKVIEQDARDTSLWHTWFVRYNPLYFVSALSILYGILLVSNGLDEAGLKERKVLLTVVLESYQLLLIAGAALLFRSGRSRRSAVILGLTAVVFLLDCTFQMEILACLEARWLAAVWVVLAALKLAALRFAFRLRAAASAFVVPIAAVVAIAWVPQILDQGDADRDTVHLLATWLAAALAAWLMSARPRLACLAPLDAWGKTVLRRATRATWAIWSGFYLAHLVAWASIFDVSWTPLHLVPVFVLMAFRIEEEAVVWAAGALAVALAMTVPATAAPSALVIAVVFAWRCRQLCCPRLMVGVVLALHVAWRAVGWQQGELPAAGLGLNLLTAVALIFLVWRQRSTTAALALAAGTVGLREHLPQLGTLAWGLVFLATGFLSLITGIAINWLQPALRPAEPE